MFVPPNVGGPSPRELEQQREERLRQGSLAELTSEDLSELATYVLDCLNHGSKPADIRSSLVAKGMSPDDAREVVRHVMEAQTGGKPRLGASPARPAGLASPAGTGKNRRRRADETAEELALLRQMGQRNMAIGGFVCIAGLIITIVSVMAVDAGGRGVIAWGAVIWGAVQYFRGMSQVNSARQ